MLCCCHCNERIGYSRIKTRKRLQSIYNILLAFLAATDLLVGIVAQPTYTAAEIFAIAGGSVDA